MVKLTYCFPKLTYCCLVNVFNDIDFIDQYILRLRLCIKQHRSSKPFNLLRVYHTKWSNTLKQFVGCLPTNCLSVFDHLWGWCLKGWSHLPQHNINLIEQIEPSFWLCNIENRELAHAGNALKRNFQRIWKTQKAKNFLWHQPC